MNKNHFLFVLFFLLSLAASRAQTPGLIVEPATGAGTAILDPNGDGYVSQSSWGFVSNDEAESEIPFVKMVFPSAEPSSDLGPGPDCGFTDFVDSGIEDPALTYFNTTTNIWYFRFRLGNIAPNSKGYSVLIDTDQKFGSSGPNADPNYNSVNPGFEIEINLQTNFGVFVYNVDGTSSPVLVASHPGATNYQKSMALTTNCGNPDYFYDFYIPFSDITSNFPGITSSTQMRMSIITQMNPQPAIGNNALSDIGGVDDAACGQSFETCIGTVIENYPPASVTSNTTLPDRSVCPSVTSPVAMNATTVSGTSSEANGTVITVFKNGSAIGTATVSAGAWSLTGISPALAAGEVITASATAPGKSESVANCSSVTVAVSCTEPLTTSGVSGNSKGICGAAGAGISGASVLLYDYSLTLIPGSYTVSADGSFQWKCNTSNANCNSGAGCLTNGAYAVTQKLSSQCESDPVWICIGTATASATPVISTSQVLYSTTSLAGTGPASSTILLYKNNAQIGKTTSSAAGNWTFSSLTLATGDQLSVKAVENGKCISAAASVSVTGTTPAPAVTGTYCTGTSITTVTGTSSAPAGTSIQVYENGVAEGSAATVTSSGTWTASSGISIAAGSVITAKATTSGWSVSAVSNAVTVGTKTTHAVSITSAPISEGVTSISGTGVNGDIIHVYVDDADAGITATVSGGVWNISGLPAYTFYADAVVYATATSAGSCESAPSASYTVQCVAPLASQSAGPSPQAICSGSTVSATVASQSQVIYQMFNGTTAVTPSRLGTGGNITLTTNALSASAAFTIKAIKIYGTNCSSTLSNKISVTVNPNPDLALTVTPQASVVCNGSSTSINIASSGSGFSYQLRDNATNAAIGTPVAGNGGTISLPTGNIAANTTFNILVTGAATSYCSGVLNTTPSVGVKAVPSTPSAAANTPVCAGGTVNLTTAAVSGATYSWTGPNGFNSTLQNPTLSNIPVAANGPYSVMVTSNGCTSAAGSVAVVVNASPSATASSNGPVCTGATINLSTPAVTGATYSWTGPDGFTSSLQNPSILNATTSMGGTYSVTVAANGCSSTASTTSVTVNAVPSTPTASSNSPVCAGGTINLSTPAVAGATYNWIGPNGYTSSLQNPSITNATVAMAGTYSVTVTTSGCTSAAGTTSVTVNAVPSAPTASSNSPVCAGGTINLSTTAVAGATYTWTGPNGFASSSQNPSITNATVAMAGTYSVTVTTSGCTSAAGTTSVTVNAVPSTPTASSNSPVCAGGTINLSIPAVAGATYNWIGPNGYTSSLQNPSITNATVAMAGTYSVTVTTSGCMSAAGTTSVTVNAVPSAPTASSNSPVCAGGTINLSAPAVAGATYNWTGPNGYTSSLQNPSITNATVAMAGTYSVTITTSGCTSAAGTTSVTVNAVPSTPTASSNSPVCAGGTINLSTPAVAGATYNWIGPNGYTSSLQNPSITNATVAMAGAYSVTVTTSGCTSAAGTVSVTVNAVPSTPTASSNSPVCAGGTINLSTPAVAGATYSWTGPNGYTSSLQNPSITNATVAMAGTYSVTVTTSGCTSAAGNIDLTVDTPVSASASNDGPYLEGGDIQLHASGSGSYSWTGPDGFTSSLRDPVISKGNTLNRGTYTLTVTAGECSSIASTDVKLNLLPLTQHDIVSFDEDGLLNGDVSLNDNNTDGPLATYTVIKQPGHGTLIFNTNGAFGLTPDKDYSGKDTIVYELCDGGMPEACVRDTIFVSVAPVNDIPVVLNETMTTATSTAIHSTFANGDNDDADGTVLVYTTIPVKAPSHGSITVNDDGSFDYQAAGGFTGKDTVVVLACDLGNPLPASCIRDTLVVTVLPDGNLSDPVVSNKIIIVQEDQSAGGMVIGAGDLDPEGTSLEVQTVPLRDPAHGSVTISASGTFSYTPQKNFSGKDTVVLQVCDQGSPVRCTADTLFIDVAAVNDAPVVFNESLPVAASGILDGSLSNGDNDDADGTALSYSSVPLKAPSHGSFSVTGDGAFHYEADPGFEGKDTVIVAVCDGGSPLPAVCVSDTLVVTVIPGNAVTDTVAIGVAKEVLGVEYVNNESFLITYRMHLKNYSSSTVHSISLKDDLGKAFPGAVELKIQNPPSATGGLTANVQFNGVTDTDMLVPANSALAADDSATVTFTVSVISGGGTFSNIAVASYTDNGKTFADTSVAGSNPDPNGNRKPDDDGEQSGTVITLPAMDFFKVPEGFSPDGDGVNDRFVILGLENYPDNTIKIYNRWGSMVFEKERYQNDWDGFSVNKLNVGANLLPAGTYFYLLDLGNKEKTIIKGYIYINR